MKEVGRGKLFGSGAVMFERDEYRKQRRSSGPVLFDVYVDPEDVRSYRKALKHVDGSVYVTDEDVTYGQLKDFLVSYGKMKPGDLGIFGEN